MIRLLFALTLLLFALLPSQAQYQLLQLNPAETQWYQNGLLRDTHRVHTAIRPWRREDVSAYSRRGELLPDSLEKRKGIWPWVGRKLWHEDFLRFSGENYELTLNPVVDFRVGQDTEADFDYTYRNSRGARIELALGDKVSAYSTLVETQARLPLHVTEKSRELRIVPGYWLRKSFRANAFDFAYAAGEVAFTPNETFHFRLGHGKQFIGEGYRSMLISDNSINYPFFRIETQFGRLKYINTWAIMTDIRPSVTVGNVYGKKYLSMHYLSLNIGRRWNLALFEGLMWGDELNRYGFDPAFLNPVILYRPVEFAQGFAGGNVMMGLNSSYRLADGLMLYGQVAMDEFTLSAVRNWSEGSWLNMFGGQIGAKYGDAFGFRNLFLQAEYNVARPHLYSHREAITNWGHYNQPLAHPWGANFNEFLVRAEYRVGRWMFTGAAHLGSVGRDGPEENWGGDIYKVHDTRSASTGVSVAQGVTGDIRYVRAELSYLFNPVYNLRLQAGYRSRRETSKTGGFPDSQYFYFGLRTNAYQMYQDF